MLLHEIQTFFSDTITDSTDKYTVTAVRWYNRHIVIVIISINF